jgi:hypothetical protein
MPEAFAARRRDPARGGVATLHLGARAAAPVAGAMRLDRRFADSAEQHCSTIVAAPHLQRGQVLADELFGGGSLGRLPRRAGAWYEAEAVQLHQRASVRNGARWEIALARDNRIVGAIKHVTLRRR